MNRYNCFSRMNGKQYLDKHNPGVALQRDFLNVDEEKSLLDELQTLFKSFSFRSCESIHLETKDKNTKTLVNAFRVTGRPEQSYQVKAPWCYGNNFQKNALDAYPEVLKLVTKVQNTIMNKEEGNPELRDITINYRSSSMFMLDPHIDPLDGNDTTNYYHYYITYPQTTIIDGGHVFILGLKSPTVMTLTPDIELLMKNPNIFRNHIEPPIKIRNQMDAISVLSWTDIDLDILIPKRGLLHLKNDARFSFKHAIRAGVEVDTSALSDDEDYKHLKSQSSQTIICDWFGNINNLIPREQERVSVILAFK